MRQQRHQLFRLLLTFTFLSLQSITCESENSDADVCTSRACEIESENILAKLDVNFDPCDDFYQFACGTFLNETIIPDDKTSVDVTTFLEERLKQQLNEILNTSITEDDIGPFACSKKLYRACLDEDLIEKRGLKPIQLIIESLGGWPVVEGKNWADNVWFWQKILLKLELLGFGARQIYASSIDVDMKNSSRKVLYIDQPNLGIDREYLIEGFDNEIVHSYYKFHVDTAVLYGAERFNAELEVKNVLNFEMDLAKILIPKEERRNMTLMHNPTTIKEFQHMFPIHDWYKFFNELMPRESKVLEDEVIILTDFKFILNNVYELLKKTPNRVVVNYLIWQTALSATDILNKEIRNRHLEFTKVQSGRKSFEVRWKECIDVVLDHLPIATSALYVKNFFKKESRDIANEMVDSIKDEFTNILKSVSWMDESTRASALEKADKMIAHIGYPDELMNNSKLIEYYEGLSISEDKFLESVLNISKFDTEKSMKDYRKPVNKSDWETHSSVAVINAFYNPLENSIQFPAGILQGTFFKADRPRYMNFGAIGSVIGHEITHGFDDEGSQFDGDGNLVDWWKEDTKQAYLKKAQCIIDQYDNYTEPNVKMNLNGVNTQGENIADNGGIKEAYLAYKSYTEKNGEEKKLPGLNFTIKQLFWISAAQSWCSVTRPEKIKLGITVDPHSPEMFRVNGPFSNMKEFFDDFECTDSSLMSREQTCEVW